MNTPENKLNPNFAANFSNNRKQKEIITSKKTKKTKMILVFSVSFDVVI